MFKEDAIDRRHNKRARSREGAQNFKDKLSHNKAIAWNKRNEEILIVAFRMTSFSILWASFG